MRVRGWVSPHGDDLAAPHARCAHTRTSHLDIIIMPVARLRGLWSCGLVLLCASTRLHAVSVDFACTCVCLSVATHLISGTCRRVAPERVRAPGGDCPLARQAAAAASGGARARCVHCCCESVRGAARQATRARVCVSVPFIHYSFAAVLLCRRQNGCGHQAAGDNIARRGTCS